MIPIPIRIQFCIASIMLYSARPRSGSRFHIVHDIIIMLLTCLVYASIKVFGHPGRVFKLLTRLFCSSFLFNGLYGLRTPLLVFAVISVCSVHAFSLPSLGVDCLFLCNSISAFRISLSKSYVFHLFRCNQSLFPYISTFLLLSGIRISSHFL